MSSEWFFDGTCAALTDVIRGNIRWAAHDTKTVGEQRADLHHAIRGAVTYPFRRALDIALEAPVNLGYAHGEQFCLSEYHAYLGAASLRIAYYIDTKTEQPYLSVSRRSAGRSHLLAHHDYYPVEYVPPTERAHHIGGTAYPLPHHTVMWLAVDAEWDGLMPLLKDQQLAFHQMISAALRASHEPCYGYAELDSLIQFNESGKVGLYDYQIVRLLRSGLAHFAPPDTGGQFDRNCDLLLTTYGQQTVQRVFKQTDKSDKTDATDNQGD